MTKECENVSFSLRGTRSLFEIYPQKRKRDPNFSTNEIQLLVSIVSKYSHITQDKKTDRTSVDAKNKVWKAIEKEFNASNSEGLFRNAQKLKKCFENRKHDIKLMEIEKSKMRYLGSNDFFMAENKKIKSEDVDEEECITHDVSEMMQSTINNKPLYDLEFNSFDTDKRTGPLRNGEDSVMESMYESESDNNQGNENENSNYKLTCVGSSNIKYACELDSNLEEGYSSAGKHSWSCGWRKNLMSQKFEEKYDKLLDRRLVLITNQIEDFEERDFRRKERKLKLQLLHLQIEALKK